MFLFCIGRFHLIIIARTYARLMPWLEQPAPNEACKLLRFIPIANIFSFLQQRQLSRAFDWPIRLEFRSATGCCNSNALVHMHSHTSHEKRSHTFLVVAAASVEPSSCQVIQR